MVVSDIFLLLIENEHARKLSLIGLLSALPMGHKIEIMIIIIISALAAFQSSELSQFVHVWPIKE